MSRGQPGFPRASRARAGTNEGKRGPGMLRKREWRWMLLAAAGVIPVVSGCLLVAAGAAGVAGVAYVKGEMKDTVPARPAQVVDGGVKALEQLGIVKVSSESSVLEGEVIGRTAGDERVRIGVKSKDEKISEISIRVGTYGDKALSRQILDKIKANL